MGFCFLEPSRLGHQIILFWDARGPASSNAVVLDGAFVLAQHFEQTPVVEFAAQPIGAGTISEGRDAMKLVYSKEEILSDPPFARLNTSTHSSEE